MHRPPRTATGALPHINRPLLFLFRRIVRRYFRRHFRSVMLQGRAHLEGHSGPLIVYGNHSSWWDPMIVILLAAELLPKARHYAPIDADALQRYPILGKLGLFAVDSTSSRSAVAFLRTAEAILAAGGVLWITPQGRFADPREESLSFRPGLGALAARVPHVPLLPLAVEYTFWDERLPEALARCGEAVRVEASDVAAVTTQLEQTLAAEMRALREVSCRRDSAAFSTVFSGGRGSGGFYGLGRRLRAWVSGKRFDPDHTSREPARRMQ